MGYERYRELVFERRSSWDLPGGCRAHAAEPLCGGDQRRREALECARCRPSLGLAVRRGEAALQPDGGGLRGISQPHGPRIGRLLDFLEETGELENTIVVFVSDNSASGEGGPNGSVNENKFFNGIPDSIEENLQYIDELGSPATYNHYPVGWAWAFNTPFKMWKRYNFEGGVADPLIVSWPKGIGAKGELRHQFLHATDIVPTMYDLLGIELPEVVKGYPRSRWKV